jgi:hypothetical protein
LYVLAYDIVELAAGRILGWALHSLIQDESWERRVVFYLVEVSKSRYGFIDEACVRAALVRPRAALLTSTCR